MPTLTLPNAGKSASNATILRWRKLAGSAVAKGEILLEIETDEGFAVVESALDGTLTEVLAPAGRTVPVGAALAKIGAVIANSPSPAPKPQPQSTPQAQSQSTSSSPMSAPTGKVIPILMPKAGQSMEEGVIVKWRVEPGAAVAKGDILFEFETDKATMEAEATDAGRLARIVVGDGGNSPVLVPVAYLADNDADVDAFIAASGGPAAAAPSAAEPAESVQPAPAATMVAAPAATTDTGRVKASPAARKIAAERGVNLAAVPQGSGVGGRILSTDVPAAGAGSTATAGAPAGVVRKRMSGMRKAIARNLTISKTTIPHWYLRSRVNAGPMMAFYRAQKEKVGCSVNDVIVMACAKAIMEFPAMHSRVDGDSILEFPGANIGVAVGMDDGLVVPVVMNAERFSLPQLAVETKRLAAQARAGKVENMGQGIFTISNLGMFGVDDFVAIVNPPEASILAVGSVKEDVVVKNGAIMAGQIMNLTLSSDHRLIDGTLGAQFMARLKALLEDPTPWIA